jgi:hypothetical protein
MDCMVVLPIESNQVLQRTERIHKKMDFARAGRGTSAFVEAVLMTWPHADVKDTKKGTLLTPYTDDAP